MSPVACPGDCTCYNAGHCLRNQCPAYTSRICNAGWAAIVRSYDEPDKAEKPHQAALAP